MKPNNRNILSKLIVLQAFILSLGTVMGQAPVANFSGTPVSGCSPLIVSFQDLSTGNPSSWLWNFGNSNTSTLQNPTATYFTPGTYTVSLTATNASGANTITRTQYITVYENPTVDFSATITSGCFPLRVQFQDLSAPGNGNSTVSWLWDFGNGTTSTLQNPFITFSTAGTYSVTLRVTNDKGCTRVLSKPNYITVTAGVTSAFTNTQATVCNAPADISFTNGSNGPPTLSYLWDFGDGNFSTLLSPTHTYTAPGTYIARLITYSTAGCNDTALSNPIVIGGFTTSFTAPAQACVNEVVNFINTSTPAPVSTIWRFGDGGTAITTDGSHAYTAAGTYRIWLYNTYSSCNDSTFADIQVNPNPVAAFSAPVRTKCEPPLTVNFQDLSTGGATSWFWDFGDGNTSTVQNPSHTYTTYGSFDVKLRVTNNFGCSDSVTLAGYVTIRRAIISIPQLPARGCIPYTITLNPVITSLDAVTSYNWDFGDGGTSTLPNPTYTYFTQGTYDVTLTITTSTGCTDDTTIVNAVRVGSKPIADFSASPIPVCATEPVQFTDLSVPADEWFWDFGDGVTSTLKDPTHAYTDTGYFDIRLIATNNGCPDTLDRLNYIYVLPPIARFTITPDCLNRLRFTFNDQSVAPLTWNWDFGDATTSTAQNPVHNYPALGSYPVRLIVTNGGCADTVFHTANAIDENPDFMSDVVVACKTRAIQFTATNINPANIINYFWDFGDGNVQNVSLPVAVNTYTQSGTFTVTLTITDLNGCTNTITKTNYIRINGPNAAFSSVNLSGCINSTVSFPNLSTDDGINPIQSWFFDFGDGQSQTFTGPPFQHTYTSTGLYDVKMIVTDAAGCRDSLTIQGMVVVTDPVPNFTTADLQTCPNAIVTFTNTSSPAGYTSIWDFGDGNSSGLNSPTHSYGLTGLYTVKLRIIDGNGCEDSITKTDYIEVSRPVAAYSMNDSISSCTPFEVQFTNNSSYYTSSLWNFGPGEGTTTTTNPTHYFTATGIYPVKLLITSPGGCLDSITHNVYLYDTVGSYVNYLPLGGCTPLPVSFNNFTPGPMASYFWDFGDGTTQTTTTPVVNHTYTSFGDFLPKLILEDPAGCIIPLAGTDTIYAIGALADFGWDDSLFCDRGLVNFTDSTTSNDPIIGYNWTFGDAGVSNVQNPSHLYANPGLYTVSLQVNTQSGCSNTMTIPDLIAVVQRPLIDIQGDSVLCIYNSLTHRGIFIQPDTSTVTWIWTFANGNSSTLQNPPAQSYNTAGTFTTMAIATNSTGCRDTTYQRLLVNPLPVIVMPAQLVVQNGFPQTIPATYSPNTVNWNWTPSTGLSCTDCPTPDAGPKINTNYTVRFIDSNGCVSSQSIQVIVICKNSNLFIPNTFSPNADGSNDVFYPRGKGLERIKLLRIFNRWGEVVFEKRDVPVNDPGAGWNGSFKGGRPIADVYVYQAEVFCENGELIKLNGNIALIL